MHAYIHNTTCIYIKYTYICIHTYFLSILPINIHTFKYMYSSVCMYVCMYVRVVSDERGGQHQCEEVRSARHLSERPRPDGGLRNTVRRRVLHRSGYPTANSQHHPLSV